MLTIKRLKSQARNIFTTVSALAILLASFATLAPTRALAAEDVQFGRIHVMALDDSGNGWAWAGILRPRPGGEPLLIGAPASSALAARDPEPFSYLLRIEGNKWSIFADSNSAPTLLVPGLDVYRMLVSSDGQEGWATGTITGADGKETPVYMHLHNGAWGPGTDVQPTGFVDRQSASFVDVQPTGFINAQSTSFLTVDATMSADGTSGFMPVEDSSPETHLLSLQSGKWAEVTQPQDANIGYISISADGNHGLAVSKTTAGYSIYELSGGKWQARANGALAQIDAQKYHIVRITADNQGNGWLLASADSSTPSILVRLSGSKAPQYTAAAQSLFLNELTVNAQGLGWAVGSMGADAAKAQPVVLRIDGDSVSVQSSAGLITASSFAMPGTTVTSSPSGQYAWIGNNSGQLDALYGYTSVGMPVTGDNNMPYAILSILVTSIALCTFGLVLLRKDSKQ